MQRLTDDQIATELGRLDGWMRVDNCIEKTYTFKNFIRALMFVNLVGYVAESMNHHPDIVVYYNKVTLRNWTHVADGLTRLDFDLARRIDEQATG